MDVEDKLSELLSYLPLSPPAVCHVGIGEKGRLVLPAHTAVGRRAAAAYKVITATLYLVVMICAASRLL